MATQNRTVPVRLPVAIAAARENATSTVSSYLTDNSLMFPVWNANAVVSAITLFTGFFCNSFVLYVFIKKSSLRTPFNIYLINLLIANLATVLFEYPFDIASALIGPGWMFGDQACSLYQYAILLLEAAMFNSHQLISMNRLWAVLHPISYRAYHSVRVATILCCCMWLYVHAVGLPITILDSAHYRLNVIKNGCYRNQTAQEEYDLAIDIVLFAWPELLMWIVLVIVLVARALRQQAHRTAVVPKSDNAGSDPRNPDVSRSTMALNASHDTDGQRNGQRKPVVHRSYATAVLIFLTISTTICWTPVNLFFFIKNFVPDFPKDHQLFLSTALALFSFQTTVDPVVFVLAVTPLQDAVMNMFKCRFSAGRAV